MEVCKITPQKIMAAIASKNNEYTTFKQAKIDVFNSPLHGGIKSA